MVMKFFYYYLKANQNLLDQDHSTVSLHPIYVLNGNIQSQDQDENRLKSSIFIFIGSTSSVLPVCQKSASEQTLRILTTFLSQVIGYLALIFFF